MLMSENCCVDDHEWFRFGERDTHRRLSETCFDMTSISESTHLIRVSRVATDDGWHQEEKLCTLAISILVEETLSTSLVEEVCPTIMLVRKLLC